MEFVREGEGEEGKLEGGRRGGGGGGGGGRRARRECVMPALCAYILMRG